jgi:hypothetical protein
VAAAGLTRGTPGGGVRTGKFQVPDKDDKTLDDIEETQAALRESIEEAKKLAEKSERLIKKHRKNVDGKA